MPPPSPSFTFPKIRIAEGFSLSLSLAVLLTHRRCFEIESRARVCVFASATEKSGRKKKIRNANMNSHQFDLPFGGEALTLCVCARVLASRPRFARRRSLTVIIASYFLIAEDRRANGRDEQPALGRNARLSRLDSNSRTESRLKSISILSGPANPRQHSLNVHFQAIKINSGIRASRLRPLERKRQMHIRRLEYEMRFRRVPLK